MTNKDFETIRKIIANEYAESNIAELEKIKSYIEQQIANLNEFNDSINSYKEDNLDESFKNLNLVAYFKTFNWEGINEASIRKVLDLISAIRNIPKCELTLQDMLDTSMNVLAETKLIPKSILAEFNIFLLKNKFHHKCNYCLGGKPIATKISKILTMNLKEFFKLNNIRYNSNFNVALADYKQIPNQFICVFDVLNFDYNSIKGSEGVGDITIMDLEVLLNRYGYSLYEPFDLNEIKRLEEERIIQHPILNTPITEQNLNEFFRVNIESDYVGNYKNMLKEVVNQLSVILGKSTTDITVKDLLENQHDSINNLGAFRIIAKILQRYDISLEEEILRKLNNVYWPTHK